MNKITQQVQVNKRKNVKELIAEMREEINEEQNKKKKGIRIGYLRWGTQKVKK